MASTRVSSRKVTRCPHRSSARWGLNHENCIFRPLKNDYQLCGYFLEKKDEGWRLFLSFVLLFVGGAGGPFFFFPCQHMEMRLKHRLNCVSTLVNS